VIAWGRRVSERWVWDDAEEEEEEVRVDESVESSLLQLLTPREQAVLGKLLQGSSNKEIASAMTCSVKTVEFHVSSLLRKAGVSSRLELVLRALR
jgi:DNA-binding NarL/FixJ family response regulator